jgi:hypothetical protein
MYQDYKDLLSAFNAHGVRYLIVGAYAVIFHAQPRFTKDMTFSFKLTLRMRERRTPHSHRSGRRLRGFDRKTSPSVAVSSDSGAIHTASTFFLRSRALNLTRPGSGASRESSIPRVASRRFSFPLPI